MCIRDSKTLSGTFTVRNRHLKVLLQEKNQDNEEVWLSILSNGGSVQHLDFLSEQEKDVYKTAFEIDQRWLIDLAGDRSEMIDQAQSLNLYISAPSGKKLDELYKSAWIKGLKTTYYLRNRAASKIEKSTSTDSNTSAEASACSIEAMKNGEACESCQ